MISYEEAIRIIDKHTQPLPSREVALYEGREHFLAEDVVAKYASPPFDNSAVDGYGRAKRDLATATLTCVGSIPAGKDANFRLLPGQCVRILTGAKVPEDVAAVAMQEYCEVDGARVTFTEESREGDHIRRAATDFATGDRILSAGDWLGPAQLSVAASAGIKHVRVVDKPTVSVLTTGSELVDLSQALTPAKIYDSNTYGLLGAVDQLVPDTKAFTTTDNPEKLRKGVMQVLGAQVAITCGGVSVGDHDLVKEELARWEVEQQFWGVAIKPGKPILFGTRGENLVFGLPGNPVSALVTFALFVRPAILKMCGHPDPWPKPWKVRFNGRVTKKAGRTEFLRGQLSEDGVRSLEGQGSHQLATLAAANCLIVFPAEAEYLEDGGAVSIIPSSWVAPAG